MAHTFLFDQVKRIFRIARYGDDRRLTTSQTLEEVARLEERRERWRNDRRELLKLAAGATAAAAVPGLWPRRASAQTQKQIAIVGAGLSGLVCADTLRSKGVAATVYEAAASLGASGRCRSLRGFFPGQTAEVGGELVDNLHKTMLGYVNAFKLPREDMGKVPGEVTYFFRGQRYDESEVVEQFRVFSKRAAADVKAAGEPTALTSTNEARTLDAMSLAAYLDSKAGDLPLIRDTLRVAYEGEYGLDANEQSCLNLLLFIHMDRRSKFAPWGVFSDERFHITTGNDGVAQGLAARLPPIRFGHALEGLSRGGGKYLLKFRGQTTPVQADAVVLTVPFSVLRTLRLDDGLGLPPEKLKAIRELGYGTNDKTMVGFGARVWLDAYDGNGATYSDVPNVQVAWETNPTLANASRAIITDYAGGTRGASIQKQTVQKQVEAWLQGMDTIYSGIAATASRNGSKYVAFRSGWPSNELSRGSYTCYKPGQFTTIAGLEGTPVDNLYFAGEHTNSFYEWQGFMEGACLSGIAAANQVLDALKRGRL
jgi:monoamine oxidase